MIASCIARASRARGQPGRFRSANCRIFPRRSQPTTAPSKTASISILRSLHFDFLNPPGPPLGKGGEGTPRDIGQKLESHPYHNRNTVSGGHKTRPYKVRGHFNRAGVEARPYA